MEKNILFLKNRDTVTKFHTKPWSCVYAFTVARIFWSNCLGGCFNASYFMLGLFSEECALCIVHCAQNLRCGSSLSTLSMIPFYQWITMLIWKITAMPIKIMCRNLIYIFNLKIINVYFAGICWWFFPFSEKWMCACMSNCSFFYFLSNFWKLLCT